jgi:hypothetical protein
MTLPLRAQNPILYWKAARTNPRSCFDGANSQKACSATFDRLSHSSRRAAQFDSPVRGATFDQEARLLHSRTAAFRSAREGLRTNEEIIPMRLALSGLLFLVLTGVASADAQKLRFADVASDACAANCSAQAESCKRACPTTFSTPCLTACDNQGGTCRRSCSAK